jgi:hypothetical protein
VGGAPSEGWGADDFTYKLAVRRDGAWVALAPFNGLRGFVEGENRFIVYQDGIWTDWTSLIGAGESSIAAAATCDIGAAETLFVAVTGSTAITSFGAAANRLRFLRFAGTPTLTHNATSLILPGGIDIAVAAGDTAVFSSDAGGNWRCRGYSKADGRMVNMASPAFTGTITVPNGTLSAASSDLKVASSGSLVFYAGTGTSAASVTTGGLYSGANNSFDLGNAANYWRTGYIAALEVSGRANLGFGASAGLTLGSSTGAARRPVLYADYDSGLDADYLVVGSPASASGVNSYISFKAGSYGSWLEIARMYSASFVIGTAANGGWSTGAKLEAKSTLGSALSGWATGSTGGDNAALLRVDSTAANLIDFRYGTNNVGSVTTTGTATAYNTSSDARLKTVLAEQNNYREAIKSLWVGDFTWKDSGAPGFGVLAQQAHDVMPNHQGVTRPAREDGTWQASAEPFAHLALWGVKDLYALADALAARLAALEAAHAAG